MRHALLVLAAAVAGCTPFVNGTSTRAEPADAGTLACVTAQMDGLGYGIVPSGDLSNNAVRGERLIYEPSGRPERARGEIIARLVQRGEDDLRLRIDAARYSLDGGGGAVIRGTTDGTGPGSIPRPEEVALQQREPARGKRVSLGPVARHVAAILDACRVRGPVQQQARAG